MTKKGSPFLPAVRQKEYICVQLIMSMATKFDKYAFEAKGEESTAISAAGDGNQSRRQVAKLINVLSAYTGRGSNPVCITVPERTKEIVDSLMESQGRTAEEAVDELYRKFLS